MFPPHSHIGPDYSGMGHLWGQWLFFKRCRDGLGATYANGSIWMIKSACPPLNMVCSPPCPQINTTSLTKLYYYVCFWGYPPLLPSMQTSYMYPPYGDDDGVCRDGGVDGYGGHLGSVHVPVVHRQHYLCERHLWNWSSLYRARVLFLLTGWGGVSLFPTLQGCAWKIWKSCVIARLMLRQVSGGV